MATKATRLDLIFQWEVRSWSRAYPLWQRALNSLEAGLPVALALGERDGGLSLMLAQHGAVVVCSDLHGPTERAMEMHKNMGWGEAITNETIDVLDIRKPDNSIDVVALKSMIGALGTKQKQLQALSEIHRVLKPGGMLLFAENLKGTALHSWLRRRFTGWSSYWRYLDREKDGDLFASFIMVEEGCTGFLASLGRSEGQRDVLARFDHLVVPLVPAKWRTIWYGVARKG